LRDVQRVPLVLQFQYVLLMTPTSRPSQALIHVSAGRRSKERGGKLGNEWKRRKKKWWEWWEK